MTFICSDLHVWNLKAYNLYENKIAIVKKTQLFLQQFYIFCMNIFIYFKCCTTLFHQWFQRNLVTEVNWNRTITKPPSIHMSTEKKEIEIRGLGKKREHIESKNIPRAMSIAIFLYCFVLSSCFREVAKKYANDIFSSIAQFIRSAKVSKCLI